jgi:ABC-type Fe3+/spermidine/putrescine transport system ATPase subunit
LSRVELVDIEKYFGDFAAVRGVDLVIEEGEFVSFLGPSGSGKTTTLRIIAGFEHPSAGDVRIGGASVLGRRANKRGVGIVFQNYALFPQMNVFENVAFGLRSQRQRGTAVDRRVREMLELVELGDLGHRRIHELSGGQQQRVALARALAVRPQVLLLDEPLGALDKKLREQMQIALMGLHRTLGMTMVYVTHDQEEALSMSQRVAVMNEGKVVQFDTSDRLYYEPMTRYVCEFVGRTNVIHTTFRGGDGARAVTSDGLTGRVMEPIASGAPCVVCVRPERVLLLSDSGGRTNTLRGWISERVFLGQTTNYVLELERGGRLEASVFSEGGEGVSGGQGTLRAVGEQVTVSFEPEHALLFADEGSERYAEAAEDVEAALAG